MTDDDIKRLRDKIVEAVVMDRRVPPDSALALLDRLEAAERERDELAALLREARDAITLAGYGSRMAPEVRDTLERIDALKAKEQTR
jgi:hypothetical protein